MSHEEANQRNFQPMNAHTGTVTMPGVEAQGAPHVQTSGIVRQSVSSFRKRSYPVRHRNYATWRPPGAI